jgi:predicted methyltransferase
MRSTLVLAFAGLVGCAPGPTPRDASHTTLPTTHAVMTTNLHAVRDRPPDPRVLDLLAAPDRTPEDRALDGTRQAADLLTFLGVSPGMRVAELASGGGYFTELFARAVGPAGVVYGENAPAMLAGSPIGAVWASRLARASDRNVVRVDRSLDDPLPKEIRALDLVYLAIDYGKLPALGVDRDAMNAMNQRVHLALRRGGRYVVLEETPRERALLTDLHALHTEESRHARREIESAGFAFESEGRFFRDASDPREWDASPEAPLRGEKHDRFVLAFVKP